MDYSIFGMDVSKFPNGYKEYLKRCWDNYRHTYNSDEEWYKEMESEYRIGCDYAIYNAKTGQYSSCIGYFLERRYAELHAKKMYPSIDFDHDKFVDPIPCSSWVLDKRHLERYFDRYRELDKFEETLK